MGVKLIIESEIFSLRFYKGCIISQVVRLDVSHREWSDRCFLRLCEQVRSWHYMLRQILNEVK